MMGVGEPFRDCAAAFNLCRTLVILYEHVSAKVRGIDDNTTGIRNCKKNIRTDCPIAERLVGLPTAESLKGNQSY
jgi:hypothetical protein